MKEIIGKEETRSMKSRWKRISAKIAGFTAMAAAAMCGTTLSSSADQFSQAARGAAEGIQAAAAGTVKWIIVIILVVTGIIFMIGTQQQKEQAKSGLLLKAVGAALVIGAVSLAGIIFKWF